MNTQIRHDTDKLRYRDLSPADKFGLWWLVGVGAMACVAFSIGLTGWPMPLITFFFR